MATDKNKQNIRFAKTSASQNKKVRYDGLLKDEVTYIKTVKKQEQSSKDLDNFYKTVKRNEVGAIDWDGMDETQLDYFDYIYKSNEKLLKKINKLEDTKIKDTDKVLNIFLQLNTNSQSF
jgi:hypothetical protein